MVHGQLLDPYDEFFIRQHVPQALQLPEQLQGSQQQQRQQREASAQEALLNWHDSFQASGA